MNFKFETIQDSFPDLSRYDTLCVDIETTSGNKNEVGLDFYKDSVQICGWGISTIEEQEEDRKAFYLPIRHNLDLMSPLKNVDISKATEWLKEHVFTKTLINHNIKFDMRFAWKDGLYPEKDLICTTTMGRIVNNEFMELSLDYLCKFYFQEGKSNAELKAYLKSIKSKDYGDVPIDIMARYNCQGDLRQTVNLYHRLKKDIPIESLELWQTEIKLTKVLLHAEVMGVKVDHKKLNENYTKTIDEVMESLEKIQSIGGPRTACLNPNSSKSIKKFLFSEYGLTPKRKTKKGTLSWDHNELVASRHPVAIEIANYSKATHFLSTYCDGYQKRVSVKGFLHGNFNQFGTNSGRLSSSDPNLQNANKLAGEVLCCHDGDIIFAYDYSQIEYRIVAHYGNDERIIKAYNENPFVDFHQTIADLLGIPRQSGKTVNFALIYGAGKPKLLLMLMVNIINNRKDTEMIKKLFSFLDIYDETQMQLTESKVSYIANRIYDKYHAQIPMIRILQRQIRERVFSKRQLRNFYGRIYRFPDPAFHYVGLNRLGQGTAGDFVKRKLVEVGEKFFPEKPSAKSIKLLTTIHDSLFLSVPKERATYELYKEIKDTLEDRKTFRVPITATGKIGHKNLTKCIEFDKNFLDTKENVEYVIEHGEKPV